MADPQMKQWVENWKHVGQVLDEERFQRLEAMTDTDARDAALRLFELWRPDWPTDNGEGLLLVQHVFARARPSPR